MILKTRTGSFPIGFRRGGSGWQHDLSSLLCWARDHGFSVLDVGADARDVLPVTRAGLSVGSVDLHNWSGLFCPDATRRAAAVKANAQLIAEAGEAGAKNFFLVILPENPDLPRSQNFGFAVESLGALVPVLEKVGGRVVLEGWPGPGVLACTPETVRALFREIPSPALGLNYDPSHLIRMGIDPLRFLKEFVARVGHVHGKDCAVLPNDVYEYGMEQPATWKPSPDFGAAAWRYTIPGQGGTNWTEVLRILKANDYAGAVSIELEDRDFNGSDEGEQRGLLMGAQFLCAC